MAYETLMDVNYWYSFIFSNKTNYLVQLIYKFKNVVKNFDSVLNFISSVIDKDIHYKTLGKIEAPLNDTYHYLKILNLMPKLIL